MTTQENIEYLPPMTDQADFEHLIEVHYLVILNEQYDPETSLKKQLRMYVHLIRNGEEALPRYQVSKYSMIENRLYTENFTFLDDAVKDYNRI